MRLPGSTHVLGSMFLAADPLIVTPSDRRAATGLPRRCANIFRLIAVNRTAPSSRCVPLAARAFCVICAVLFTMPLSLGADPAAAQAAKVLADRIAAKLDPKASYRVEFRDLTGQMPATEFAEARNAFMSEFSTRGMQIAPSSQPVSIWIKLSRDVGSRLWIGEFPQNASLLPEIIEFPVEAESGLAPQTAFALRKQLIFQQRTPILDFAIAGPVVNPDTPLLIVAREQIGRFRFQNGAWQVAGSFLPIQFRSLPRDVIANITSNGANFLARVGSVNCTGSIADLSSTTCSTGSPNLWGLGSNGFKTQDAVYATGRNWFEWEARSREVSAPVTLFSSAGLVASGQAIRVDAETNGITNVYDLGTRAVLASVSGWGSFVARVPDSCGADGLVAATRSGDYTLSDAVQVFQWAGAGFRSVGAEIQFEGPVLALSPDATRSIRAVVHNLKTGFYEAYLLNPACAP